MFGHKFCSLSDMISDERSFRLTTKIELVEVRELTESTDWFLPFHLLHLASSHQRTVSGERTIEKDRFRVPFAHIALGFYSNIGTGGG